MQSGYSDESGSLMFGILLVVSTLFLLFWGLQYALLQEWYLFRKKASWVEWLDIAKVQNLPRWKGGAARKEVVSSTYCTLYQQKADIRAAKQWGYHQLKMMNPCYSDLFRQLKIDYYLSAVTDHQDIVHSQYRYEANTVQYKLSNASLVLFSRVDDENVKVIIQYDDQHYTYLLPYKVDANVLQYQLVEGVVPGGKGVALIVNQTLWLLPFTGDKTPRAQDLPFKRSSIWVAALVMPIGDKHGDNSRDKIEDNGIYFLIYDHQSQLQLYRKDLYQGQWERLGEWAFTAVVEEILGSNSPNWQLGGWQLLRLDQVGVVIQLEGKSWLKSHQRLFAINWEGRPIWGNNPIWVRTDIREFDCGLQQRLFEPINGWALGCQRLQIGKIVVE